MNTPPLDLVVAGIRHALPDAAPFWRVRHVGDAGLTVVLHDRRTLYANPVRIEGLEPWQVFDLRGEADHLPPIGVGHVGTRMFALDVPDQLAAFSAALPEPSARTLARLWCRYAKTQLPRGGAQILLASASALAEQWPATASVPIPGLHDLTEEETEPGVRVYRFCSYRLDGFVTLGVYGWRATFGPGARLRFEVEPLAEGVVYHADA